MRKWITTGITLTLCLGLGVVKASALPDLFDWGFNLDGTTFCNLGPCDFDVDITGNISGPGDLPGSINTGGFDFSSGLGTLDITFDPGVAGSFAVDVFLDHEIDEPINTFFNEFGDTNGLPAAGQSWEIDEPGLLFGDVFDNFLDSTLDNANGVPSGLDDDVAMALGWDFTLTDGQSAFMSFQVSDVDPGGFSLAHTDPDSNETIFFSSTLEIRGDVIPLPVPGTFVLCSMGLIGLVAYGRKWRKRHV